MGLCDTGTAASSEGVITPTVTTDKECCYYCTVTLHFITPGGSCNPWECLSPLGVVVTPGGICNPWGYL